MDLSLYGERDGGAPGPLMRARSPQARSPQITRAVAAAPSVRFYGEENLVLREPAEQRAGTVLRRVAEMCAAHSAPERQRLVRGWLHAIGFDWLGYGSLSCARGEVNVQSFFTSYAYPAWSDRYFSERYFRIDPRLQEVPSSGLPLVWDIDFVEQRLAAGAPQARSFVDDLRESGLGSGVMFVLASDNQPSTRTFISLMSRSMERQWITDEVVGQALTLGLSVHDFLTRRAFAATPAPQSGLSSLQQEILRCLVRGLSDKEIASRLNLSSYNVDYHLRQMRRRFAARNRVQLVSVAMSGALAGTAEE